MGIAEAAIAVGSCSAVARRLPASRRRCSDCLADGGLADAIQSAPMTELSPIADVRGSAEYRLDAVREIVARAVLTAAGPMNDHMVAAA